MARTLEELQTLVTQRSQEQINTLTETLIKSLEAHRYGIGAGKSLNLSIEP